VYVRPADDYEVRSKRSWSYSVLDIPPLQQALDFAQKEFPEELSDVSRDRISFNISATMGGERRAIRISESAWVAAVARLLRGEVIDVTVKPLPKSPKSSDAKDIEPPQYLEVPQPVSQSRASRSTPASPAHSRQTSPSGQSEKGSSRSWFGKH
jgi:hypothetical protein